MNEGLLLKKSVLKVKNYLNRFDLSISLINLDTTARTAQDAGSSLNVETGAIVKSLLFKSTNNNNCFYLCLVSGDKFVSLNKLSEITKNQIIIANATDVKNQTGFSIGGVAPIAHLNSPDIIFIDKNLKRFNKIFAAAGHHSVVFEITYNQLCDLTNGKEAEITE